MPELLFSISDTQIKQESFLEDINNLLNAGEVPNLYPLDEKQEICEKMRQLDRYGHELKNIVPYNPIAGIYLCTKTSDQLKQWE